MTYLLLDIPVMNADPFGHALSYMPCLSSVIFLLFTVCYSGLLHNRVATNFIEPWFGRFCSGCVFDSWVVKDVQEHYSLYKFTLGLFCRPIYSGMHLIKMHYKPFRFKRSINTSGMKKAHSIAARARASLPDVVDLIYDVKILQPTL